MHQYRRLKRLPCRFTSHSGGCQATQFIIGQRQQFLGRLAFAAVDGVENQRDVAHVASLSKHNCFRH